MMAMMIIEVLFHFHVYIPEFTEVLNICFDGIILNARIINKNSILYCYVLKQLVNFDMFREKIISKEKTNVVGDIIQT